MPVYVALLRGINVSGQKIVRMEALRESFCGLGFGRVRTYVQSGNVVFDGTGAAGGLGAKISARIKRDFGFDVPVIVRRAEELAGVFKRNPFLKEKGVDPKCLHVTFLAEKPARAALKKLEPLLALAGKDRMHCMGAEAYLHCPNGYGGTKLSNTALERVLGVGATTRNWNSVGKLVEMAGE